MGRDRVQTETQEFLQQLMDTYESGIQITEVKLQTVEAPSQVKDAFDEVVRAREDREKLINQARGYREDLIPKARGEVQEIVQAAEAYKEERTLRAKGDGSRFNAVLTEYRKGAPGDAGEDAPRSHRARASQSRQDHRGLPRSQERGAAAAAQGHGGISGSRRQVMNRSYIVGIVVGAIVVVLLFPPVRPFFVVGEWQQSIVTQFGKFKRARARAGTSLEDAVGGKTSPCTKGASWPATRSPGTT